jgi:Flp pilus assembly protein TadG
MKMIECDLSMTLTRARRRNVERGAATLLEAAFSMAILLALFMGIVDFSRALYAYHFVSHAAREATRYASVRGTTFTGTACTAPTFKYQCMTDTAGADILAYVNNMVPTGIPVTSTKNTSGGTCSAVSGAALALNVCSQWPGVGANGSAGGFCDATDAGVNSPGCVVKVTVQYNFKFIFNSLGILPNGAYYTLSSTSQMIIGE